MMRRTSRPFLRPRGPILWLRVALYGIVLVAVQGVLSRWLEPVGWLAPDLFLLTAVACAWRLPPSRALLAAYGIGFMQDLLGGGFLGFHAAGLAGGVLLVLLLKRVTGQGTVQSLISIVLATLGQWLTFGLLGYWLRNGQITTALFERIVPMTLLMTLLIYGIWDRWVVWAFGPRPSPKDGLG